MIILAVILAGGCAGGNRPPGSEMGPCTRRGIRELKLAHRTTIMMTGDRRTGGTGDWCGRRGAFMGKIAEKAAAAGVAGAAAGM